MQQIDFLFRQTSSEALTIEKLVDGSVVVLEHGSKTVHSLNPIAAAALQAIENPTELAKIAKLISTSLKCPISEQEALAALTELENAGLAELQESKGPQRSRRAMMRAVAGVAAPMVLTMTAAEQRMFAQAAGSGARLLSASQLNCSAVSTTTIIGQGTHFTNSSVVTFSPSVVTVLAVSALSATNLQVQVRAPSAGGTFSVTVTTGSEVVSAPALLTVTSNCG